MLARRRPIRSLALSVSHVDVPKAIQAFYPCPPLRPKKWYQRGSYFITLIRFDCIRPDFQRYRLFLPSIICMGHGHGARCKEMSTTHHFRYGSSPQSGPGTVLDVYRPLLASEEQVWKATLFGATIKYPLLKESLRPSRCVQRRDFEFCSRCSIRVLVYSYR